jgi:hypothetical protein
MGSLDIHGLSEGHQFVILLLVQVSSIISMVLLYRSAPTEKKKPLNGNDPTLPHQ